MDAALADDRLTVDTSPLSQIDKRFLHILFASLLTHMLIAVWVNRQPHVVAEDPYETVPDRFTKAPLLPIPKVFPPVKAQPPSPAPPPGKRPNNPGPGRPSPNLTGLLATALADFDKGVTASEKAALEGAQRGPLDTRLLGSRRERGPTELQSVGPVVTNGARDVRLGEHADVGVPRGKVEDIEIEEVPEVPDPQLFMRYITARKGAFTACYERELKHNPTLRGRVTVHFTVANDGRPHEIDVSPDTLRSSEVTGCMEGVIRRWLFPVKPDGEVPMQFPVLFTPATG